MDELSNAFSVLELDMEDAKEHTMIATAADGDGERVKKQECGVKDNGKIKDNHSGDGNSSKSGNEGEQSSELIREEYKSPLVWIDLETTGLNIEVDRILEIACIITDTQIGEKHKNIIFHDSIAQYSKSFFTGMPPNNYISCFQNEKKNFISSQMNLYMRVNHQLLGILSCGIIFVISCKAVNSWKNFKSRHKLDKLYNKNASRKESKHRAPDDIKESIAELKYYKNIFKPKSEN
ncbi:oligoribonuclease [Olea europaea var. sylvestris]|uniref:oligoribonuclease n=1 Tax=Olea europaea var. sylvestris TaxID=158386 RepID=UPI000C1D780B|nr:oligoribonuclease [Olea europaea var. sylvestris]